jgi:Tfp pilus assembly protein PilF
MQYQKAGQYREAISSWKQAMNSGADSGRVQQQIGHCYQKLGRNSEAVESYKQAISIYKGQQADGRNPNDVQRNIRSCEAAIRISTP